MRWAADFLDSFPPALRIAALVQAALIAGMAARLYQCTAIDDCTRLRVLKVYDACNQRTAIRFIDQVRHRLPFRIQVVQTDNGAEFQSQFHWHLESLDIRHVYIRPRTPHLNGKVERRTGSRTRWSRRAAQVLYAIMSLKRAADLAR